VSRHGYQFVWAEVSEEDDDHGWPARSRRRARGAGGSAEPAIAADPFEPLLQRVTRVPAGAADAEDQREAAELLHALGTADALARLASRPGTRAHGPSCVTRGGDIAGAGDVPILGAPSSAEGRLAPGRLRLRRAARIAASRWPARRSAAALPARSAAPLAERFWRVTHGHGIAGGDSGTRRRRRGVRRGRRRRRRRRAVGSGGGVPVAPDHRARRRRRTGRRRRRRGREWLSRWTLAALVGVHLDVGGGIEGVVIGGAAGLGYAAATALAEGGLAAPRGWRRAAAAGVVALACGLAALTLAASGRALAGGTVHAIAQASRGSQVVLTPLGRLVGEPDFGPISAAIFGTGEGALFGLAWRWDSPAGRGSRLVGRV
jgi:hypothetical protein